MKGKLIIRPRKGLHFVQPELSDEKKFWSVYRAVEDGTEEWLADCASRETAERLVEKAYVLVEVRGGVADVTATRGNVEVAVVDWDNIDAGDQIDPDLLDHPVFGPWIDADRS